MTSRRRLLSLLPAALGFALAFGAATAMAAPKKVVLVLNGNLGDKSFFDSAARGMKMIKDKYGAGVETRIIEMGTDQSKWQPGLDDVAGQDWDLIITGTYQMPEILAQVAEDHPDKKFIIFDSTMDYSKGANKNVYSITYKQNEASYLAGVMAAGMIKTGAIPASEGTQLGFLGGMDIPVINDFLAGYVAGAESVDPGIKIAVSYAGTFSDAAKGKELAMVHHSGVGIGFNVASQTGLGQLAAAKDMNRLVIGVDSDQEAIFRTTDPATADKVVTSVLKRVDASLLRAYGLFVDGKLPFGHTEQLGLKEGAVGIVKNAVYDKLVPASVRKQEDQAEADIASGKIVVPTAFGMTTAQINALRAKVRP